MASRVFVSCGQATTAERRVAADVRRWFKDQGYLPHVAIEAQSLEDVNSGIIEELKRSDFYVFIDLRREPLPRKGRFFGLCGTKRYRGSLFTNQELAVAQVLRFAKVIFLQQEGVELEGLLKYMGSNAAHFTRTSEVVPLLEKLVREREWMPIYSRHLEVGDPHWTPVLPYFDHTGTKMVRVFELDIHNRRSDLAALNAVARLTRLVASGGATRDGLDTSELKVVGHAGYSQAIWPDRHAAWDLFAVHVDLPATISLNSALDIRPRRPIISSAGEYVLTYEVFAVNFPVLTFDIRVCLTDDPVAISVSVEPAVT